MQHHQVELKGKTAIITGGGTGVGRAIARDMLAEGMNVVICGRRVTVVEQAAAELSAGAVGQIKAYGADVSDSDQVGGLIDFTLSAFGHIDVLVNNAGFGVEPSVLDCTEAQWDSVMNANAKGTFLMSKAVLPGMIAQKSGYILNIASQAALNGYANAAPYCASKFAVVGFGLALQEEVREHGIHVHSLNPGLIQTHEPSGSDGIDNGLIQVSDMAQWALFLIKQPRRLNIQNVGLTGF